MSFKNILKKSVVLVFCLFILIAFHHDVRAQGGILKGTVKDNKGNPLNKVKVTLVDPERGTKLVTSSNDKGEFIKIGIPPSPYLVTFSLDGYFPSEIRVAFGIEMEKVVAVTLYKQPPKLDQDKDFNEGTKYFQEEKFREATVSFKKVTEKYPESYEAFYNLALGSLRSGDVDQAICSLNKVIELKPDILDAYFALGECYFQKGDMGKAHEVFAKITEMQPTNAKTYYNLGIVYYKSDKTDEAILSFEKALEIDPKYSSAAYQAGLVCIRKGDYQKAVK